MKVYLGKYGADVESIESAKVVAGMETKKKASDKDIRLMMSKATANHDKSKVFGNQTFQHLRANFEA